MKRAAVITGGSGGIGSAAAYRLAEDGYIPVINYFTNYISQNKTYDEEIICRFTFGALFYLLFHYWI